MGARRTPPALKNAGKVSPMCGSHCAAHGRSASSLGIGLWGSSLLALAAGELAGTEVGGGGPVERQHRPGGHRSGGPLGGGPVGGGRCEPRGGGGRGVAVRGPGRARRVGSHGPAEMAVEVGVTVEEGCGPGSASEGGSPIPLPVGGSGASKLSERRVRKSVGGQKGGGRTESAPRPSRRCATDAAATADACCSRIRPCTAALSAATILDRPAASSSTTCWVGPVSWGKGREDVGRSGRTFHDLRGGWGPVDQRGAGGCWYWGPYAVCVGTGASQGACRPGVCATFRYWPAPYGTATLGA